MVQTPFLYGFASETFSDAFFYLSNSIPIKINRRKIMAYKDFSLIVINSPPYHPTEPTGLLKGKASSNYPHYIIRKKEKFFQSFCKF